MQKKLTGSQRRLPQKKINAFLSRFNVLKHLTDNWFLNELFKVLAALVVFLCPRL